MIWPDKDLQNPRSGGPFVLFGQIDFHDRCRGSTGSFVRLVVDFQSRSMDNKKNSELPIANRQDEKPEMSPRSIYGHQEADNIDYIAIRQASSRYRSRYCNPFLPQANPNHTRRKMPAKRELVS